MEGFIEKFFYSPTNLSVIEFLGNFFINILAFAFPIFLLVALVILIFEWLSKGAHSHEFRQLAIQLIGSIVVVAILLFTPGRKDIQYNNISTKSYFIIDTLNDIMVLGGRFADGFVYHMLFGNNYSTSSQKLFTFVPGGFLQLDTSGAVPNGNDIVDGFFLQSMNQFMSQKVETLNKEKQEQLESVKTIIDEGKANYDESINKIKNMVNGSGHPIEETLPIFQNLTKLTKNYEEEKKKWLEGKSIASDQFIDKVVEFNNHFLDDNTLFDDTSKNLGSIISFVNNNGLDSYDGNKKIEIVYDKPTYLIGGEGGFDKYVLGNGSKSIVTQTKEKVNIPAANLNNEIKFNDLKSVISKVYKDKEIAKSYENYETMIKNEFNINITDNTYYKTHNNNLKIDENTIYNDIKTKYNTHPNIAPILKKIEMNTPLTTKESSEYSNFYFKVLDMKIKKKLFIINNAITALKHSSNPQEALNAINLEYFLKYMSENVPTNDKAVALRDLGNTLITSKLDNSKQLYKNADVLVDNAAKSLYMSQNKLGKLSNEGIKLDDLYNNKLFAKKIDDLLLVEISGQTTVEVETNNGGMSFEKEIKTETDEEMYSKLHAKEFHWYDLGKYSMGLKNLYITQNSLYSFASGLENQNNATNFMNKCTNIMQKQKNDPNAIQYMSAEAQNSCFPSKGMLVEDAFNQIANTIGFFKGIISAFNSYYNMQSSLIGSIITGIYKPAEAIVGIVSVVVGIGTMIVYSTIVYIIFMFFYYLIPMIFFTISVMSWLFKSSLALITFGFSIILFMFNHKKQQLESSIINVIVYSLMPIYISFMFLMVIHTSFIVTMTVDNIFSLSSTGMNANSSLEKKLADLNPEQQQKVMEHMANYENAQNWLEKSANGILVFSDKIEKYSAINVITNLIENSINMVKTFSASAALLMFLDYFFSMIKLVIIISFEFMLFTNLYKVDRFVNEVIGTHIKDVDMGAEKVVSNFGGSLKGLAA